MNTSISELGLVVAGNFMDSVINSLENAVDISMLVKDMEEYLHRVGTEAIAHLLESADEIVRESAERKREWEIHSSSLPTTLTTIFGDVHYERTYYKHKEQAKTYMFLSDRMMGIEAHDKTDALLASRMIEESIDLAYRKSGKKVSRASEFTGQTVMKKIRQLGDITATDTPVQRALKKQVSVLYVEADEDHVALQTGGQVEPRLVYIHEGKKCTTVDITGDVKKPRFELINKRCFGGVYKDYEQLWLEVANYIEEVYDTQ
ncbi:MAG: UPF0236 family protein, partial [Clostridiales Family XIII bacterium]|nr:UPF0236 family protein [Clostridiales Family XIII bacterium]